MVPFEADLGKEGLCEITQAWLVRVSVKIGTGGCVTQRPGAGNATNICHAVSPLPAQQQNLLLSVSPSVVHYQFLDPYAYTPMTMAPIAHAYHETAHILVRSAAGLLLQRDLKVRGAQGVTLGVIAAYVVGIAILWNVPYLRYVLWPFKMLVIAFHEFSHASTACCTGGRVESITLDPHEGGVTHMRGGISAITLPAGYLGSSLIGMLLTFCGVSIVASKVASIVLGVCFLLTLWWGKRDWLTILTVLLAVGLLVACWFIAHAEALRFVVLFIGVMSSLYR